MVGEVSSDLPPGFRFHPTDEELIMYYLRNQATSRPCPVSIIPEVDIYKFDPWELPDKTQIGENEWYFFSPRDRKYPNGVRPNRAAVSGYWKATGTDKPIYSGSKYVGVKKALVFYKGRPSKGIKTDWIMNEYRLSEYQSRSSSSHAGPNKLHGGSMRLDDWVLCRIYKKRIIVKPCEQQGDLSVASKVLVDDSDHQANVETREDDRNEFPRTFSLSHLWDFGNYMGSIPQLSNENLYNNNSSNNTLPFDNTARVDEKFQLGQVLVQKPCTTDAVKFEVVNESIMFVDPVFGFQR